VHGKSLVVSESREDLTIIQWLAGSAEAKAEPANRYLENASRVFAEGEN
jgi:hypothetical protein